MVMIVIRQAESRYAFQCVEDINHKTVELV